MNNKNLPKRIFVVRGALLALWLAMVGWLVVSEAYPHLFTRAATGYRAMLGDILMRDQWMRIDVLGSPAGYSHTTIESGGNTPDAFTVLRHEMRMELNLMGQRQDLASDLTANLDPWQRLQSFVFKLYAGDYHLYLQAKREEGTSFRVKTTTANSRQSFAVTIPDDAVVGDLAWELALRDLRPGQSVSLQTFDPATMAMMPVVVKALRREQINVRGTNVMATVVAATIAGMQTLSWVDEEGRSLRADSGFGWTFEVCEAPEAMAALRAGRTAPQEDLLRRLAVTCQPPIDPARTRRIKLRLSGVPALTANDLSSPRQHAVLDADGSLLLESHAATVPTSAAVTAAAPPAAYLAASRTIQSDHPEIIAAARRITAEAATPLARARAINLWVQKNMRREMTISLPSALDVLRTLRGDCNEHTVLAVALARAAGVPAVMKAGLVWHKDAFYYHAWPAFFADGWFETDPTLDQPLADATHLALAEGEVADQIAILKFMGKLRLQLLEAE